jgi:hypothetical protein
MAVVWSPERGALNGNVPYEDRFCLEVSPKGFLRERHDPETVHAADPDK